MHMTHDYARAGQAPLVVKYGGNALAGDGTADPVLAEIAGRHFSGEPIVLVHGGGPEIDRALAERGVETQRIDGLRVTGATTLAVTEAVLCGTLNKRLVRALGALGVRAAGISGQDGALLVAARTAVANGADLGYVGTIVRTDPHLVRTLLAAGFLPVVAPLALARDCAHAYNVNADLAAAAIAAALHARAFVIVTNVPRVLRDPTDPSSGIDSLTLDEAHHFAQSDACRSSMKPKLEAAISALTTAYICAAGPNAISRALAGDCTTVCHPERNAPAVSS
jgi:acetylglutamate kinase